MDRILVSACLLGQPVRYDGRAKEIRDALLTRWRGEGRLVPICPEVGAGFGTPRPPAEIMAGFDGRDVLEGKARVLEAGGADATAAFLEGARLALETARRNDCRFALLTDGSPSCGSTFIYDGGFDGRAKPGPGVVAALLSAEGIAVFAETRIAELAKALEGGGGS
ncbi:MAG: DUF523 domain-containing protein [Kiloniellales bacterium]|nr:DUF523 domain-containing protein [Kiloniellales bacterium]